MLTLTYVDALGRTKVLQFHTRAGYEMAMSTAREAGLTVVE